MPPSANFSNATNKSSSLFIVPPSSLASLEPESDNSSKIFLNPVDAELASTPRSTNFPRIESVVSKLIFAAADAGATFAIATPIFSISNALVADALANKSATCVDSSASILKAFKVEATILAVSPKSVLKAIDNLLIASVDLLISSGVNPNLTSSS